jgi:hypothetical protein
MDPMNKISLSDDQRRRAPLGLSLMAIGLIGFFLGMSYLKLFNTFIEYDFAGLSKIIFAFSFVVLGIYGLGYVFGGNRSGLSSVKYCALLFIIAGFLGYIRFAFQGPLR